MCMEFKTIRYMLHATTLNAERRDSMTELEKAAKQYSKYDNSCVKCAWNASPWCNCPYSDGLMEEYKIDCCYFGVYRFMSGGDLCRDEKNLIEFLNEKRKRMYEKDQINEGSL